MYVGGTLSGNDSSTYPVYFQNTNMPLRGWYFGGDLSSTGVISRESHLFVHYEGYG